MLFRSKQGLSAIFNLWPGLIFKSQHSLALPFMTIIYNTNSKPMKTFQKIALATIALSIISCSSDSDNNTNDTGLNKKIIYQTQSLNPTANTKEIQYFSNNQIVADTVFNHLNEWTHRKIIVTTGNTKSFQTLNTNNEIIERSDYTYDNQGRILSRRILVPLNLLTVTFTYNPDNTITVNAVNSDDMSSIYVGTYYKNSNGLVYKEVRPGTADPSILYENTLQYDNLKPMSVAYSNGNVTAFDYYPNQKPTDILKSTNELNNGVISGLSLVIMAENGNFYFKRTGGSSNGITTTYQTDFNAGNYIEYIKSTYINTNTSNNLLTTEVFYYYN